LKTHWDAATKIWRIEVMDKMYMCIDADVGIRRILSLKNEEQCLKMRIKCG
jgi:predicted DNA-binding protein (MmcQ/YjbR family)